MRQSILAQLVEPAQWVLLDFDGPVCDIFAGYPAASIAEELLDKIAADGNSVAPALMGERDPLQVLRVVGRMYGPDVTRTIEEAFTAAEVQAVPDAVPTPGAIEVIEAAQSTGRSLAIVSNNSRQAVLAYLRANRLDGFFRSIVGRYEDMNPALLKPSPHLVQLAIQGEDVSPAACMLVGDSITDIEAAAAASVVGIGLANKPGKNEAMVDVGADAVLGTMNELAIALREAPYHE